MGFIDIESITARPIFPLLHPLTNLWRSSLWHAGHIVRILGYSFDCDEVTILREAMGNICGPLMTVS